MTERYTGRINLDAEDMPSAQQALSWLKKKMADGLEGYFVLRDSRGRPAGTANIVKIKVDGGPEREVGLPVGWRTYGPYTALCIAQGCGRVWKLEGLTRHDELAHPGGKTL